MSLEKLKQVLVANKGKYYTVRIRNIEDLLVVKEVAEELGYVCDEPSNYLFVDRWEIHVHHKYNAQFICFYDDNGFNVYNHDCGTECLFDFTKEM